MEVISPQPDLTDSQGILKYLGDGPFKPKHGLHSIEFVPKGGVNYIYRVELAQPYRIPSSSKDEVSHVIVKHGEERQKTLADRYLYSQRLAVEFAILGELPGQLAKMSKDVALHPSTPVCYMYDRASRTLFMEDLGRCETLGNFLKGLSAEEDGSRSRLWIQQLGSAIGQYLAHLHSIPLEKLLGGTILRQEDFQGSKDLFGTKFFSSQAVEESLKRCELLYSPEERWKVAAIVQEKSRQLLCSNVCFTHGDFYNGNVVLDPGAMTNSSTEAPESAGCQLRIIDWELSRPGLPCFDVGLFIGDLVYNRAKATDPVYRTRITLLLAEFWTSYQERYEQLGSDQAINPRDIVICVGIHLIVIFPFVNGWLVDDLDKMKEIVKAGMGILLEEPTSEDVLHRILA